MILTGKKFSDFEKNSFIKADLDYNDRFGVKSGVWPTKSGKIEIFSQFLKSRNQSPFPIYTEQKMSKKYPKMPYGTSWQPPRKMSKKCLESVLVLGPALEKCQENVRKVSPRHF